MLQSDDNGLIPKINLLLVQKRGNNCDERLRFKNPIKFIHFPTYTGKLSAATVV